MRPWVVGVLMLLAGRAIAVVEVAHVYHEPLLFHPDRGEVVAIRFQLSEPAHTRIHIHDGRDLRIRTIDAGELDAGAHTVAWNGRDEAGRQVPPEAYPFTIEAVSGANQPVVWDVTDQTGGDRLDTTALSWDPDEGLVRYNLHAPARVRIRIGLANDGPLLLTLLDWVPRATGLHQEPWDGRDASRALDLNRHPNLALVGAAFALPRNAILVGPAPAEVTVVSDLPNAVARQKGGKPRPRMFDFARQALEDRRDFPVRVTLPQSLDETSDGLPIVQGPVTIRVDAAPADLERIMNERCEAAFFVDGQFVFEAEVAFLPVTWTWDTQGVNPGPHHVSVNVRGYEGHFGVGTTKVWVGSTAAVSAAPEPPLPPTSPAMGAVR